MFFWFHSQSVSGLLAHVWNHIIIKELAFCFYFVGSARGLFVRWNLNIRPKTCFWNLQQVCELLENFLTKLPTSFLSICKSKEQLLFGCGRTDILGGFREPVTKNSYVICTCRVLSKIWFDNRPNSDWEVEENPRVQVSTKCQYFSLNLQLGPEFAIATVGEVSTGYWSLKTEPYYSEQGLQVGIIVYQRISLLGSGPSCKYFGIPRPSRSNLGRFTM